MEDIEAAPPAASLGQALEEGLQSPEPLIFTQADPPFAITHVNAAWEQLCGYTAQEAVGQTCRILQGVDTSREALKSLRDALEQRVDVSVRLLNYTKQGSAFLNDLTVQPLSKDGHSVTHFRGQLHAWRPPEALPEYPRAFETPGEAERTKGDRQRMPTTIDEAISSTEFAAVVTEPTPPFRITNVNARWCNLCGFSIEEALGQTLRMLQGPNTCRSTLQALRTAAVAGTPVTVRLLNFTKVRAPTRLWLVRARATSGALLGSARAPLPPPFFSAPCVLTARPRPSRLGRTSGRSSTRCT